jgi:hypothetical protein
MKIEISKKDLIKIISGFYPDHKQEQNDLINKTYISCYDRRGHWRGLENLSEKQLLEIYNILRYEN